MLNQKVTSFFALDFDENSLSQFLLFKSQQKEHGCRQYNRRDGGGNDEQLKPAQSTLRELTNVLCLAEKKGSDDNTDKFIDLLVEVRKQKLWQFADLIRNQLKELGIALEDTKEGTTWRQG